MDKQERIGRIQPPANAGITVEPEKTAEEKSSVKGGFGSIGRHLKERLSLSTIGKEMFETITDKIIPQGANELAHALFTGSAFSPYGYSVPPPGETTVQLEKKAEKIVDMEEAVQRERDKRKEMEIG